MSSVPRTPPLAGDKPQPYIFLAGAGTPGYENWVHWLMGGSVSSVPRTPPLAGDKPQPYIFLSTRGVAGAPGCENRVHWLMGGSGVVRATHPAPGGGQAPALRFSIDAGRRRQAREPLQPIPDRSPGHAFVPMT